MLQTDSNQVNFKCTQCKLEFKRRGMFVNHLSKRHPNIDISTVNELNQPIVRPRSTYQCQFCHKVSSYFFISDAFMIFNAFF